MQKYHYFPPSAIKDVILHKHMSSFVVPYGQYKQWAELSRALLTFHHIQPIKPRVGFRIVDAWAFYVKVLKMRKITFKQIRLQKADEKNLHKWMTENQEDFDTLMFSTVQSGYKFSMTYDPSNQSYIVSLTGTEEAVHNKNYSFSSWSDNAFEAVMICLYKHLVLAGSGDWSNIETSKANWG